VKVIVRALFEEKIDVWDEDDVKKIEEAVRRGDAEEVLAIVNEYDDQLQGDLRDAEVYGCIISEVAEREGEVGRVLARTGQEVPVRVKLS